MNPVLADENIPRVSVELLRAAGMDRGLLARGEITLEGRFTVVTREQIRQRPLPDSRRTTER